MKTIETKRLVLRGLRLEDIGDFHEYAKNPNVCNASSGINWKLKKIKRKSLRFLKGFATDEVWAIVLKENGRVIGHLKITADENRGQFSERHSAYLISYALAEEHWGRGYMTEAVKRAVQYVFEEMHAELLGVFHVPDNVRSKRVIEKCGFQYEGTIERGHKAFDGRVFDSVCYRIMKADYDQK